MTTIKALNKITFIIITLSFAPQTIICMDYFEPSCYYRTESQAMVMLREKNIIMADELAIQTPCHSPYHLLDFSKKSISYCYSGFYSDYRSMDIDENNTKIISSLGPYYDSKKEYRLEIREIKSLYSTHPIIKKELHCKYAPQVAFLKNNNAIVSTDQSLLIWDTEKNTLDPVPINNTHFSINESCPLPIAAKNNKYAYYSNQSNSLFINNGNDDEPNYFIMFALSQCSLPLDIIRIIFSHDPAFSPFKQIQFPEIYDNINSIEFSKNGEHIALTGENSITLYTFKNINHDDKNKNKNKSTTIPLSGFSTFHPNNKTILILPWNKKTLMAIDIKTQKLIYKQAVNNDPIKKPAYGDQNKILAFNEAGDIFAIAFYKYCLTYKVSKSLQEFFKTYNPKTVLALKKDDLFKKDDLIEKDDLIKKDDLIEKKQNYDDPFKNKNSIEKKQNCIVQ